MQEKAARDAQSGDNKADKAERDARDKKDIAARQGASAENFQLGQDANDSLSGQEGTFSNPDQSIPPEFWSHFKVAHRQMSDQNLVFAVERHVQEGPL